jgi:hypothetical protein
LHRKIFDGHSLSCPATHTSKLRAGGTLTTSDVAEAWREGEGCWSDPVAPTLKWLYWKRITMPLDADYSK